MRQYIEGFLFVAWIGFILAVYVYLGGGVEEDMNIFLDMVDRWILFYVVYVYPGGDMNIFLDMVDCRILFYVAFGLAGLLAALVWWLMERK